jgi:hypothetical protein
MKSNAEIYELARRDAILVCGFTGVSELTPQQVLKIDLIASLRLAVDNVAGRLISGNDDRQDLGKLISACDALIRLLPTGPENLAPAPGVDGAGVREQLEKLIADVAEAEAVEEIKQTAILAARVEQLEAENARLRETSPAPPPPQPRPSPRPHYSEGFRIGESGEPWRGCDGIRTSGKFPWTRSY